MWISLKLYSLLLLINSDIILAHSRVNSFSSSSTCLKYLEESKKPDFSVLRKRISEIKCLEYTWQVKDNIDRERLRIVCNREYGIAGGKSTAITKFPHMAALGWITKDDKWSFLCGGSLISPNFVLTAAHCTKTTAPELKYSCPRIVRMGVTNIYEEMPSYEKPVDRKILEIIIHPHYKSPKKYFDIALIKIDEVTNFTRYVHPACLHSTMDDIKHPLDATGWGLTSKKKSSPVLQSAELDIIDWRECKNIVYNRNWKGFATHQSCAGKLDGSAGTCNGDSGAPLQYRKETQFDDNINMNVIVGITSFGRKCDRHLQPLGVYVNISYFIDWIESHVWPREEIYFLPFN